LLLLGVTVGVVLLPMRPLRPAARSGPTANVGQVDVREEPAGPPSREAAGPAAPPDPASDDPAVAGNELAQRAASPGSDDLADTTAALPPGTVMENMRTMFRQYSSRFGGNPVGTNPEITASLNGANPGRAVFIKAADGLRISGAGELVDNWGTPFFFHQISRTEMEIRSAGPDRRMWTGDDLVVR